MKTKIPWTDETWGVVRGCSRVSPGCENCYAERLASRFSGLGRAFEGLARGGRWTGEVRLIEKKLTEPLHWRKPRMVFANSMSDLFHDSLSDQQIEEVFAVMSLCPQHTFQLLTKRSARMQDWFSDRTGPRAMNVRGAAYRMDFRGAYDRRWPLPNVWLGVSVEDQKRADERLPGLLAASAAVRFVSCEPLLGPVDLSRYLRGIREFGNEIDWVIAGCESGPGRRPAKLEWFRSLRDQCVAAGVPYFMKQIGRGGKVVKMPRLDGKVWGEYPEVSKP